MKKSILIPVLLSVISQPTHGMLRALATRFTRATQTMRTQLPKIISPAVKSTPINQKIVQKPLIALVQPKAQSGLLERLSARIRTIGTSLKNYWTQSKQTMRTSWENHAYGIAPLVPMATVAVAATLLKPKALAEGKVKGEQTMPPASLWYHYAQGATLTRHQMTQHFIRDCAEHAHENSLIPAHTPNHTTVRVATYNVHMWKDPYGKHNFNAILDTIGSINADVLVLQEVLMFDQPAIMKALYDKGYSFTSAGQTTRIGGKFFGNLVASKYPFAHHPRAKTYDADKPYAGERRCYIPATIQLPSNKKITVYGTHLDVYDQTETLRTQEVKELITRIQTNAENCIIAGDFNAVRARDYDYLIGGKKVWDMLNENNKKRTGMPTPTQALETLEHHNFKDSFTKNNQQTPRYTVWSGTAVDFMYVNAAWNLPIKQSYVYYSSASDHLPVLMDIIIE